MSPFDAVDSLLTRAVGLIFIDIVLVTTAISDRVAWLMTVS